MTGVKQVKGLKIINMPQQGGNAVANLDRAAKRIGFFRNVAAPLTKSLGIKSPGIDNLVSKGYGKKRKRKSGKGNRK